MIALREFHLDFDPDELVRSVADRFAPPRLGVRLSVAELYEAGRAGLARGVAAGEGDRDALAGHVEAAIRRAIPPRHEGLIGRVVQFFAGRGVDDDDLWQEGQVGLLEAADRYEPEQGWKFSTYATWWVQRYVRDAAVYRAPLIYVPHHTVQELARVVGAEVSPRGEKTASASRRGRTQEEATRYRIAQAYRARRPIAQESALEAPLSEIAPDPRGPGGDDPADADAAERRAVVDRLLAELDPRDRAMLADRFGLEDGRERTLGQVGERHGLTKERIRQRLQRAGTVMRAAAERLELAVSA